MSCFYVRIFIPFLKEIPSPIHASVEFVEVLEANSNANLLHSLGLVLVQKCRQIWISKDVTMLITSKFTINIRVLVIDWLNFWAGCLMPSAYLGAMILSTLSRSSRQLMSCWTAQLFHHMLLLIPNCWYLFTMSGTIITWNKLGVLNQNIITYRHIFLFLFFVVLYQSFFLLHHSCTISQNLYDGIGVIINSLSQILSSTVHP